MKKSRILAIAAFFIGILLSRNEVAGAIDHDNSIASSNDTALSLSLPSPSLAPSMHDGFPILSAAINISVLESVDDEYASPSDKHHQARRITFRRFFLFVFFGGFLLTCYFVGPSLCGEEYHDLKVNEFDACWDFNADDLKTHRDDDDGQIITEEKMKEWEDEEAKAKGEALSAVEEGRANKMEVETKVETEVETESAI